jgi:hypothetical protein
MPTYRVFIDNIDTGDTVTAKDFNDAYFDVASTRPLSYQNEVRLMEINSSDHRL